MFFNSNERKMSFGLLIMRVGLAAALFIHAVPKLVGGAHSVAERRYGVELSSDRRSPAGDGIGRSSP